MPRTRTYGLDIDTIRYAQRIKSGSGTTILPEPLKQINKFVVGVKKLGLWNSMVCWPMRSIHNAGTGSTVYSLGGFGIRNGVMVNSPSWSINGINSFSGANRYVVASNMGDVSIKDPNKLTFITCTNNNITGSGFTGQLISFKFGAQDIGLYGLGDTLVESRFTLTGSSSSARRTMSRGGYEFITSLCRGFRAQIYLNGLFFIESVTQVSGTIAFSDTSLEMGGTTISGSGSRNYAFCCYFEGVEIDNSLIYALYKRTLGIGLNLP